MHIAIIAALTFAAASASASEMVRLEGGTFRMGSEAHYREEAEGGGHDGDRARDGRLHLGHRPHREAILRLTRLTGKKAELDPSDAQGWGRNAVGNPRALL